MVEFCVAAPLLVLLLWSIWCLSDMYTIKNKTLVAARYGSWLLSRYDNLPRHEIDINDVRGLIANNFFNGSMDGLDVDDQTVSGETDDEIIQLINDDLVTVYPAWTEMIIDRIKNYLVKNDYVDRPSTYSISVTREFPNVFGAVDLRDLHPGPFPIISKHHLVGNSWDGGRVELHDLFEIVQNEIEDIIFQRDEAIREYNGESSP